VRTILGGCIFRPPMRLLFVTPEVTPYSGSTPAGDASWALPKALRARGHEVSILSPLYGFIDPAARSLARRLRKVNVDLAAGKRAFEVYDARTPAGIDVLFLGQDELFARCKSLPTGEDPADGVRFGAFCKAAIEILKGDERGFDVVHCHDWQTALVPVLVSMMDLDIPIVQTVHDVRAQGVFGSDLVTALDLPTRLFAIDGLEFYGKTNLLKGGVLEADRVTTVSPSYAREIAQEGRGAGLDGVFRERARELSGIAGGVDVAVWNPATDAYLESRFDPMDLAGKRRSKAGFQRDLGLPIRDDVALIVALGPLAPSSGLDAIARIAARLLRNDLQLAVIAEGGESDASLVSVLGEHAQRWADRLVVRADANTSTVHRALAAADAVLVPPNQPPGGSTQMRAHRYGALAIGPRSGSVTDTVVDCDAKLSTGDGFLFDPGSDDAVLAAIQRAVAGFSKRSTFEKTRARAMRADHSWERCAYLYERLYAAI
jgi:starch synthase